MDLEEESEKVIPEREIAAAWALKASRGIPGPCGLSELRHSKYELPVVWSFSSAAAW